METFFVTHLNYQRRGKMLPPRQQPRPSGLQTSLSLVVSPDACGSPNPQERGSTSDHVRDSPSESASSRETWPMSDALMAKKLEKEKENGYAENSVVRNVSNSDKISLRDIARERVDVIADRMRNLPDEYLEKFKHELRVILEGLGGSQHRDEFLFLQRLVNSRGDLTDGTLCITHRTQLEILVAIMTGIQAFLHPSVSLSQASLIDIFLYKRCRNIACGSVLPAEECSCEICSKKIGFCNLCMCGFVTSLILSNGQIGMGPSVKNGASSAETLFRCHACSRTSELLGWAKDVFQHCAPSWDADAFVRELDFVRRIFQRSEDARGSKLFWKCEELIEKLKGGVADPMACKVILSFFQDLDVDPSKSQENDEGGRLIAPQEAFNKIADVVQEAIRKMEAVAEEKLRMVKKARLSLEACDQELKDKAREVTALKMERQRKKQQIDELESIVRLKQAEADMFDLKAGEARREAERLQRIALAKTEKLEDDYASRYLKQRLSEAEAEKQFLFEKIKLQESSRASQSSAGGSDPSQMMYSKIQDLIKNM
ncbi:hypothetical protein RND71_008144 [Anisodus tanguticus]|uniref:OBERON-like protein n=1 Tax=Anisodus tanguticus TaxID=243964 RepID=A0AAE1VU23_9SOLA|nr:hypothetical protein RND71_008144 [Anisodus tanguticus]